MAQSGPGGVHRKKSRGHKKSKRSTRNKFSGKYAKQRVRTERNKAKRRRQ